MIQDTFDLGASRGARARSVCSSPPRRSAFSTMARDSGKRGLGTGCVASSTRAPRSWTTEGDRPPRGPRVLVIDNYDSFVVNAVHLLVQLGQPVEVVRNDEASAAELARGAWRALVISPGPGRPENAGVSVELIRRLGPRVPVLGICLGHQAIAVAYGGRISTARRPLHGSADLVRHEGAGLLRGLPSPFPAARYHSLVVDPARPGRGLEATAWSSEGDVMSLRHRSHPVEGVQFHPESYLTPLGPRIVAAFLRRAGARPRASGRVVR